MPAAAQTLHERRYTPVDVGTYTTVEECLSAIERVRSTRAASYRATTGIMVDTMPLNSEAQKWRPDTVRFTAARCAAGFREPAALLAEYPVQWLVQLYLAADQDTVAAALVAQRMAAIPATDSAARDSIEWEVIRAYDQAQPKRHEVLARLYAQKLQPLTDPLARVRAYNDLAEAAYDASDTARALTHLRQLMEEWERVPAARRVNRAGQPLPIAATVLRRLHHRELLDSLRQGTSNYLAFQQTLWARAIGAELAATWPLRADLIGKPAPPLVGDFWFGRSAAGRSAGESAPPAPPGKVGLVVFINPLRNPPTRSQAPANPIHFGCHPEVVVGGFEEAYKAGEPCRPLFAVLRRLAQRFPDLEITLVTQTMGNFSTAAQPDPAKEAELLRKWLLEGHRVPATVVVQTTKVSRLADPDRRAIYHEASNPISYRAHLLGGELVSPYSSVGFLVDQSGLVVHQGAVGRLTEGRYAELIELLRQRAPGGAGSSAPVPQGDM